MEKYSHTSFAKKITMNNQILAAYVAKKVTYILQAVIK